MTRENLTQFDVTSITELQEHPDGTKDYEILGVFTSVEDVEGQYWCYLLADEHGVLVPQYQNFDAESRRASFICHKPEVPPRIRRYTHLNANWRPYQVWMVEEGDWPWTSAVFKASDATSTRYLADDGKYYRWVKKHDGQPLTEGMELVPSGWDHEHCELCNIHIDPGDEAHVDNADHWLCSSCYLKYRVPRSLAYLREL